MALRYAGAIGGCGFIAAWSLSSLQSLALGTAQLTSPTGNSCFITGHGFNCFPNGRLLCMHVNSRKVTYFICCRWTCDEREIYMWGGSVISLHTYRFIPNVNSWCLCLTLRCTAASECSRGFIAAVNVWLASDLSSDSIVHGGAGGLLFHRSVGSFPGWSKYPWLDKVILIPLTIWWELLCVLNGRMLRSWLQCSKEFWPTARLLGIMILQHSCLSMCKMITCSSFN